MEPWLWAPETWAGIQAVIIAGVGGITWRQLREARRLRKATLRAFLVVDFEVESGDV